MKVLLHSLSAYCKTLLFHRILISRFPYVENSLHFNFADFPVLVAQTNVIIEIRPVLLSTVYNTKNIAYHIKF